ncbi:MAG: DNA polymerase III subunit delta [bacterium]
MARERAASDPPRGSAEEKLKSLDEDSPFWLLYGQERYFVRKAVLALKQKIVPRPDLEPVLYRALRGPEIDAPNLVAFAETMPFFEQRQMILVRQAQELKNPGHESLLRYIDDPPPFTCLVLTAGEKLPEGVFFRHLHERYPGRCLGFPGLKRSQLQPWISRIAREKGIERHLTAQLADDLLASVGPDLEKLEGQMEKLALFFQSEESDPAHPASALFSPIGIEESYRLADALLEGGWGEALKHLQQSLAQGTPPLIALSRISREMRSIWRIKECLELRENLSAVCAALKIPSFKQDAYVAAARRCAWNRIRGIFFSLEATDQALKSSRIPAQVHLEEVCAEIALALGRRGGRG